MRAAEIAVRAVAPNVLRSGPRAGPAIMSHKEPIFVVPTYRLRDVGETIERYDENFRRNGHSVRMMVFDDSTPSTHEKYYPLLTQTRTANEVYYVGPREKAAFVRFLLDRLRDRRLEPLVKSLFRPSYGGNRNCTLLYTLGDLMVSADDDMRPDALIEDGWPSLGEGEISHGRLRKAGGGGFTRRSFDVLSAYLDVLGKPAAEAPGNYARGELVVDTAMDLETNATKGLVRENSLLLQPGAIAQGAVVKIAQTFRTGTNDIDAVDFVDMFLGDGALASLSDVDDVYVLSNFRPVVTNKNWRIDCGVAGYDNTQGLPPFFPTRLRFEDYSFRLWIQKEGVAAAHVAAAQLHTKSNYMRNPAAAEIFNEEVCNLIKRKIKSAPYAIEDLGIRIDYEGDVATADADEILGRMTALHARVLASAQAAESGARREALGGLAENLSKAFYGFDPDFFLQNMARIVEDAVSMFRGALDLWPSLVEIGHFHKHRRPLPMVRVANRDAQGVRRPARPVLG
jgi:hypothetical protein